MTGFMQPPVADEITPRSWRATIFTCVGLVVIVITMFRLGRPEPFDETKVQPILPATEETLAQGVAAVRKGDGATGYALLLPHAQAGSRLAQSGIGTLYWNGFFGNALRDHCKAAIWFDKSARAGFGYAMLQLSTLYAKGAGIKRNEEKAYLWYRQASRSLDPPLDVKTQDRIMREIESYLPHAYRPDPGSPRAAELDEIFAVWDYSYETPVIASPLPDIPVIDLFAELFWARSRGCHSRLTNLP
jgi:hypothetical protein